MALIFLLPCRCVWFAYITRTCHGYSMREFGLVLLLFLVDVGIYFSICFGVEEILRVC